MRRPSVAAAALLATCASALTATARAESTRPPSQAPLPVDPARCGDPERAILDEGPIRIGIRNADFATGHAACRATALTVAERFGLVIDTPGFYGAIAADTLVAGRLTVGERGEIDATLEAVHYEWVQNAVIKASNVALGNATIGGSWRLGGDGTALAVTPYGRLLVPTAMGASGVGTVGLELGSAFAWRPRRWLDLHGFLAVTLDGGVATDPAAATAVRTAAIGDAGLALAPARWLAFALDVDVSSGRVALLDRLAPSLAVRLRLGRLGVELAATAPLAGADRHTAIAALRLGYRF